MLSLELPTWSGIVAGAAFAAVVSPNGASGFYAGSGSGSVVTGPVTCTPIGGTPPYTYLWSNVGGDPEIQATSGTSPTTTFYASPPPFEFSYVALFQCQVTDSLAAVVQSNVITVEIDRTT